MHIAGGFYREQCCVPEWDAVFGSGGRAAAAIATLSPGSTLHTYAENCNSEEIVSLKEMGVDVRISPRPTAIVFAYFHPLSNPHIQPPLDIIKKLPAIKVKGDAVLRFGFLEGDAVVEAQRAVYDPQAWRNPAQFGENGSIAQELAVVLNELELKSATGLNNLESAAYHLMKQQGARIVVVKRGIKGATVFDCDGNVSQIPVYRSSRVFKIGTGDVFSAIFTHFWAEEGLKPANAADIASKTVSAYCGSGRLPISDELRDLKPVQYNSPGPVVIEGRANTLGQRYTMEEARFILRELGVEVFCPALDDRTTRAVKAVLVLADGLDLKSVKNICSKNVGMPIVVLGENKLQDREPLDEKGNVAITSDFVTALYFAAWAAAENNKQHMANKLLADGGQISFP